MEPPWWTWVELTMLFGVLGNEPLRFPTIDNTKMTYYNFTTGNKMILLRGSWQAQLYWWNGSIKSAVNTSAIPHDDWFQASRQWLVLSSEKTLPTFIHSLTTGLPKRALHLQPLNSVLLCKKKINNSSNKITLNRSE